MGIAANLPTEVKIDLCSRSLKSIKIFIYRIHFGSIKIIVATLIFLIGFHKPIGLEPNAGNMGAGFENSGFLKSPMGFIVAVVLQFRKKKVTE